MHSNEMVTLVGLGRNGACPDFVQRTEDLLKEANFSTNIIKLNSASLNFAERHSTCQVLLNKVRIVLSLGKTKVINEILINNQIGNLGIVIFCFPHPWDNAIIRAIKKQIPEFSYVRILHDSKRHPGDIWPTNAWIKKALQADAIVTLSEFVASQVSDTSNSVFVGAHPSFNISKLTHRSEMLNHLPPDYDLVIGRLKKYQDVGKTIKFWLKKFKGTKRKLVIAGNKSSRFKPRYWNNEQICIISRRLTSQEFRFLVENASEVLCMYSEGSQSGVVAMCQTLRTRVIVSNIGGLPEQVRNFGGGRVVIDKNQYLQLRNDESTEYKTEIMDKIFLRALSDAIDFVRLKTLKKVTCDSKRVQERHRAKIS